MLRSVLSVLAGYAAMAVLVIIATIVASKVILRATDMRSVSTLKPTPFYLAVNLLYSALFAGVGGFVTASIADHSPVGHACVLGGLMVVMTVVSSLQSKSSLQPKWYLGVLMVLGPLCAVLGGVLRK